MFSREDLECLDPGYFEIIYMDDRDVTIMSRNTRHMWYIHNPEVELEDVEADSGGETEAGTTQRDVVRHGVAQIPVSFSVTAKWLKKLAGYAKLDKISVQYFDVETSELKLSEMYVTGYKAKLKKDTSYKGLWTVSFTLKEM